VLTGEFVLGIGDAAGMFPIDPTTLSYDEAKLAIFDSLVSNSSVPPLAKLLPNVRRAGEDAGRLSEKGAALLGITWTLETIIPVAAPEGDQVTALAGSLIGKAGTVSCCFGTSVCANAVGDRAFAGVSSAVDHFCAADGKPINMVWLRNGTTFLNTMVASYGCVADNSGKDPFAIVMPELLAAPSDCGGLLALPFMDDEPGLDVSQGGSALIVGLNPENAGVGNVVKAALLSTMFNLRLGCAVLDEQGYPRTELVLTGGLTKTPECGQILADVFDSPVTLLASAEEGCSWGAAVLAKYRYLLAADSAYSTDWPAFLDSIAAQREKTRFTPNPDDVRAFKEMFGRYQRLVKLQPQITAAVLPDHKL
jgi:sugar (pentulose or hexulose) kinase